MSHITPESLQRYEKLKAIRKRTDLVLPATRYFAKTFRGLDKIEHPLRLRGYQVQGVLHLLGMLRFVLGDDTGLGKTIETIAALCHIWEKDPHRKVIILTTKSAVNQWAKEFDRFTLGVEVTTIKAMTPKRREKIHESFLTEGEGPKVLVMNYALARADFSRMQSWQDFILVLDEVTAVKNPSAQIHKVCRSLAIRSQRCWGLTATLIKNNLIEGYGIYKVVFPQVFDMSKTNFMRDFCITRLQKIAGSNRQVLVIAGYRKEDILRFRRTMDPYFLGRAKHDVDKELPTLLCRQVDVGLSAAQQALYAEALSDVLQVGEGDNADHKEVSKLTAIGYCQQIVNHPALIDREGDSKKFDALLDILSDGDLADEKVILFSRFRKMVDLIVPALNAKHKGKKDYCVRITGAENTKQREHAQELFQDVDSETRVVCITMAGSDAINLQAAKAIIFYDTPWSAGDYLQIIGRMIRIGSLHSSVYAIHFISRKTVDERVMKVLLSKMSLVEAVLGKKLKGTEGEDEGFQVPQGSGTSELFEALRKDALKIGKGKT